MHMRGCVYTLACINTQREKERERKQLIKKMTCQYLLTVVTLLVFIIFLVFHAFLFYFCSIFGFKYWAVCMGSKCPTMEPHS